MNTHYDMDYDMDYNDDLDSRSVDEIYDDTEDPSRGFERMFEKALSLEDDLAGAREDLTKAWNEVRGLQQDLEELREKLQDPNTVHTNILHGQIKLTKAQAIHIAGLPADVEEQLAELRNEMVRKSDDRVRIEVLKKDYKDLHGIFWEQKREIIELRRDRDRLNWLETVTNFIDVGSGDYRFVAGPGEMRKYTDEAMRRHADIDQAIRHSQTENGEGEG